MISLRHFLFAAAFCLLLAISGNAQTGYNFSRGVLWTGQAVDLATTEIFLHRGYQEGNPLMRNRPVRILASTALTATVDILTKKLRLEHPRAAMIINLTAGGGRIAVGLTWNLGGSKR